MKMRKWFRKMKRYRNRILCVLMMSAAVLGTFLPGWFLFVRSERELSLVTAAPPEYYSAANMAIARNASVQLGTYQKLQLISGRWESVRKQASSYEVELKAYTAAQIARDQIEDMYQKKLYPVSLASDYGNWFTWDAKRYKAVDATFGTYAAYYWDITFDKYDGTEKHRICMLENGTIFLVEADVEGKIDTSGLRKNYAERMFSGEYFSEEGQIKTQRMDIPGQSVSSYLAFLDLDAEDLTWVSLSQTSSGEEGYELIQASSSHRYVTAVRPAN